ncbi:hypothetical protein BC831DRAFT_510653 [Entophlyctis helioformis]|nr:hypothetical protein BC831DRAFT_510653 [Entophlyctis helioformis]
MPGFVAVRCCQCRLPQVQQAKKSAKWTCRVCNQTQSLMRVLFESHSAAECRAAVQQISMQAAERDQAAAVLIHTAVSAAAAQAAEAPQASEASQAAQTADADIQPPLPPGHRAPIFSKARSLQQPASHAQPAPRHPRTDWSLFVEPEEQDDSRAGEADAHGSDDPCEIEQHVSTAQPGVGDASRDTACTPAAIAAQDAGDQRTTAAAAASKWGAFVEQDDDDGYH